MFYEAKHDFGTVLINLDDVSSVAIAHDISEDTNYQLDSYCRISMKSGGKIPVHEKEFYKIRKILLKV